MYKKKNYVCVLQLYECIFYHSAVDISEMIAHEVICSALTVVPAKRHFIFILIMNMYITKSFTGTCMVFIYLFFVTHTHRFIGKNGCNLFVVSS